MQTHIVTVTGYGSGMSSEPMQTHIVTVTGYGSGGDGIARLEDGRVVFIRGAARGDVLEVRLVEEKPRSAKAEITRVMEPSPNRIEPDCPAYPACGGCDFRHITYEEELAAKLSRVNDALERIGGLSIRVSEILTTGRTEGYRNKAVLHSDGTSLGFFRSNSHEVIPVSGCLLLKDDINKAMKNLTPEGEILLHGGITLRSGRNGIDGPLEEELDGLVFGISGFFQVNTAAASLLYKKAREFAALKKNETLVDIYCGVGSLTLFVGRDAGYALGVELDRSAVETARENAKRNNMAHVEFLSADAAKWDSDRFHAGSKISAGKIPAGTRPTGKISAGTRPDCIIVDPPRKGLSPAVIRKLLETAPARIVYISCDPATLARDLRKLEGYTPQKICAVDMFPRTANVECCCLLTR